MAGETVKRLGRPPDAGERRREMLKVRITSHERDKLEAAAARHGFSVSEYVRSVTIERDMLN